MLDDNTRDRHKTIRGDKDEVFGGWEQLKAET